MATARDRKAMLQILELYHKDFPYLWDKTNSMYNNKSMRNDAYKVLTQIYRDNFDADASVDTLKKKLENMRTTYYRELKKVKESMRSGTDEIYEPSLWYFEKLNFLSDLYEPCRYANDPRRSVPTDPLKTEDAFDNSNSDQEYEPSSSQANTSKGIDQRKKQKITVFTHHEQSHSAPQYNTSNSSTMKNEDWEVMGRSIGLQLRDISQKQLTIASKLISDTIYYAKLNKLSEESRIDIGTPAVNDSLCAMCAAQVGD
ncbi:uncharacterized protein LOC142978522 [Anticarsia gemmatalis]|uniref:uncharacterized protein LOC142978522 n=1 Tax=Anticarsia gemmatalis TaxID=129554 RepID=UPI003F76FBCB